MWEGYASSRVGVGQSLEKVVPVGLGPSRIASSFRGVFFVKNAIARAVLGRSTVLLLTSGCLLSSRDARLGSRAQIPGQRRVLEAREN